MSNEILPFADLNAVVGHLRDVLDTKKYILLYAYNGTGKTRLSMAFKEAGRVGETRDTLYFNAFTEDLFYWDNDLDNDTERVLRINKDSSFFDGLQELEMESRIGPLLERYADFSFFIDYDTWSINFTREVPGGTSTEAIDHIKISRGEENIFIWCFFLAIAELAVEEQEAYKWVKYIYIDDPISSLDDNNAIAVASHLAQLLKTQENKVKTVISSHHSLFFNVMCSELKNAVRYFLSKDDGAGNYALKDTSKTPFYHHVSLIKYLYEVAKSGELYTYHFNILRNILEKTAAFHGFDNFADCIKKRPDDPDGILHARIINVLSHGNYSLFEPVLMLEENKGYFRSILDEFRTSYRFNPELFGEDKTDQTNQS